MRATLLGAKHVAEKIALRFPFASEIAAGVSIASVQLQYTVKTGTDATPAAMLVGAPVIVDGSGEVFQMVMGGAPSTTYLAVMVATLSNGLVLVRAGVLPVISFT